MINISLVVVVSFVPIFCPMITTRNVFLNSQLHWYFHKLFFCIVICSTNFLYIRVWLVAMCKKILFYCCHSTVAWCNLFCVKRPCVQPYSHAHGHNFKKIKNSRILLRKSAFQNVASNRLCMRHLHKLSRG